MTEKLFYTDSHLQEFTAEVVSCRPDMRQFFQDLPFFQKAAVRQLIPV